MTEGVSAFQSKVLVESHTLFLTNPKVLRLLGKVGTEKGKQENQVVAIEAPEGGTVWTADKSVQESDTEMKNWVIVFKNPVIVGQFEANSLNAKGGEFALAYSMAYFRRPEDKYPMASGDVDAREGAVATGVTAAAVSGADVSGAATNVATVNTSALEEPGEMIMEGIYQLKDDTGAALLFDKKGEVNTRIHPGQQGPDGNYRFTRFKLTVPDRTGQSAFIAFEVRGADQNELKAKIQEFITTKMQDYY